MLEPSGPNFAPHPTKKKVRAAGLSQQELDKTIAQAIAWTKKQERGRMPVPRTNPQAKRR